MTNINEKAPVRCAKSILIHSEPEKVWEVLTDINNWPNWQKDIAKAEIAGKLMPETTFSWKSGGVKIHSRLHTTMANESLGWSGKSLGISAIHNWSLEACDEGTLVRVNESMDGFLARLFHKSFNSSLATGMHRWLNFLKMECEEHSLTPELSIHKKKAE